MRITDNDSCSAIRKREASLSCQKHFPSGTDTTTLLQKQGGQARERATGLRLYTANLKAEETGEPTGTRGLPDRPLKPVPRPSGERRPPTSEGKGAPLPPKRRDSQRNQRSRLRSPPPLTRLSRLFSSTFPLIQPSIQTLSF